MRTLIIVRHAKSSKDDLFMKDFDRPLNKRGEKDAPEMAKRLIEKKVTIDAFISSPAVRALSTAIAFAKGYDVKKKEIIQQEDLYDSEVEDFYDVIKSTDDKYNNIALFSHNPGITEFINTLTNTRIDNLPTSGVFAIKTGVASWKDFKSALKEFWFIDYPKKED